MNILFTICGRAGSKGLKNKNLKEMNGKPLVYYTLDVISQFQKKYKDEKVFVALNTDSKELQELVKKYDDIENLFIATRKESLAGDRVGKVDVIKDTYLQVKDEFQCEFDYVIDLDITSPMRVLLDVENALDTMKQSKDKQPSYDVVFSVVPSRRSPYFNMVECKDDGLYRKVCDSNFTARQQAPEVYELNASIYVYNPTFLNKEITKTLLDYNCGISVMKDYLVLDIDSEEDFVMMEKLMPEFEEFK